MRSWIGVANVEDRGWSLPLGRISVMEGMFNGVVGFSEVEIVLKGVCS